MKKLALVILLAVVASRLLSEDRRPPEPPRPIQLVAAPFRRIDLPGPPSPAAGDGQAAAPDQAIPILPAPPAPPRDTIRTVPWRKAKGLSPTRPPGAARPDGIPPWFPRTEAEEEARARADETGVRVLLGRLSSTEDRARRDLRLRLEREVAAWLAPDVPGSWQVPSPALDAMVRDTYVRTTVRSLKPAPPGSTSAEDPATPDLSADGLRSLDELYTLHQAGQRLDFSPSRRSLLVEIYRDGVAAWRLRWLGVGVVAVLAILAALAGYIRFDEATRGYYTSRIRLGTLAALGAAGAAAYYYVLA